MRIEILDFNAIRILDADRLDPITVMLRDMPGAYHAGQVIVECYGQAWSAFFGSIGERPLVKFLSADPEYLADKLGRAKETKAEQAYLLRITKAVATACAELAATPAPSATGVHTHRCGDPAGATLEQLLDVIYLQQRDSGNATAEMREYLYRVVGRTF